MHMKTSTVPGKAIFLDRDGVINVKLPKDSYVSRTSDFELLPGVAEALSLLKRLGYLLVVITNQRGIARGFMTDEDLGQVHCFMDNLLQDSGVLLDGLYFCPHDECEYCDCRKPEPGMIVAACKDLGIDPQLSFMVGDSPSDIDAGRRAGAQTVRIGPTRDDQADFTFPSLSDFADFLRRETDGNDTQPLGSR
jgi:D-glycero-D-manno-heptose 1,7-bisphosphate phosphatase